MSPRYLLVWPDGREKSYCLWDEESHRYYQIKRGNILHVATEGTVMRCCIKVMPETGFPESFTVGSVPKFPVSPKDL